MKNKNLLLTAIIYFFIGLVWMGLESLLYGEIQPRKVDNIMSLIYSPFIYFTMVYFTEKTNCQNKYL